MRSIRNRAIAGGAVWAALSISLGVIGISTYLDREVLKRFDATLFGRHTQVLVALANNHSDMERLTFSIGDPVYQRPFSGQYWQVIGPDGSLHASRSLMDEVLSESQNMNTEAVVETRLGPNGGNLRVIGQQVQLDDASIWNVHVASSLDGLIAEQKKLRQNLTLSFGIIAAIGMLGAVLLTSTILRPLRNLGAEVHSRWDSDEELNPESYPEEVAPLVADIDELLKRNRDIVARSRRQSADLAHAIKTPSAVLRNELEGLPKTPEIDRAVAALDRLDAQLQRSFARIRSSGFSGSAAKSIDLAVPLGRLSRAFTALAENKDRELQVSYPQKVRMRIDPADFEELLGNLLDNALKWSARKMRLNVTTSDTGLVLLVEDDGPGIPKADRRKALLSGQRLDTTVTGTGLGLAIASDLCAAYGGTICLDTSEDLGGLKVQVAFPNKKTQHNSEE